MRPVLELIARVGPSDANVLITGEHGTGKEVIAKTLYAFSPRVSKPLVTVNAGGLSEGIFESELFGHVKGAFTDAKVDRVGRFELADGGTLFLDEIANVPLNLQAKLLRVLETGEMERVGSSKTRKVDVRILAATNADVNAEVASGRFRQDLLFRLNTIEIALPPLRERREDIPLLANHFLRMYAQRYRKTLSGFESAAMQAMMEHPWPGNVRELDHSVERAVLLAQAKSSARLRSGVAHSFFRRAAASRRNEPRRCGAISRAAHARAIRWQRKPGRSRAGPEPQRAISPHAEIRTMSELHLERRIVMLTVVAGLPGSVAALLLLWMGPTPQKSVGRLPS